MGVFRYHWNKIPETYRGVTLFVLCLLCSNFLWELTIKGDESGDEVVTFCGMNISWLFYDAQLWFAEKTHRGLDLLGVYSQLIFENIEFANGHRSSIIAGCTAIKQFFIMTVILLFARGRLVHKSLYWLLSMLLLVVYNILRLVVLTYVVRNHREMFELMHVHVMKYMFYGLMFLLWLLWDEWLRKRLGKRKAN